MRMAGYQPKNEEIEWSRHRQRHVTLKGQGRDPNILRVHYLENSWRWYLATVTNY